MDDTFADPFAYRAALECALHAARTLVAADDEELEPLFAASRLPDRFEAVLTFGRAAAALGLTGYAEERARECDPSGTRDSDLDRWSRRHAIAHAAAGRGAEARAELARRPKAGMTADTVEAFFEEHRRRRSGDYQELLAERLAAAGVTAHEFADFYLSRPAGLPEHAADRIGAWLCPLCRRTPDAQPAGAPVAGPGPAARAADPPATGRKKQPSEVRARAILRVIGEANRPLVRKQIRRALGLTKDGTLGHHLACMVEPGRRLVNIPGQGYWPAALPRPE